MTLETMTLCNVVIFDMKDVYYNINYLYIPIHTHLYINTHMHTYIDTYMHAYMHSYIHTYIRLFVTPFICILQDGQTALHIAAKECREKVMALLLDRGADPNLVDKVTQPDIVLIVIT